MAVRIHQIQELQRVVVGPESAHFIYIYQVSCNAATLRRCTFDGSTRCGGGGGCC